MVRGPGAEAGDVEVEVVEAADDVLVAADERPPRAGGGDTERRPASGRRRAVLVAGVVALVAAVGAAQLVESGRSPTAGVVDGRIGSVPTRPTPLWRADGSSWSVVGDGVVAHATQDGGVTVRELRSGDLVAVRTGREVGSCDLPVDLPVRGGPSSVVYCSRDAVGTGTASDVVLTAVSTHDGSTVWEHAVPSTGGWSMVTALRDGTDDVLWSVMSGTTVRVTRLASADGQVRWSAELWTAQHGTLRVRVTDDDVVVNESTVLDLATGDHVADGVQTDDVAITVDVPVPRGSGRLAFTTSSTELTVLDHDGRERFVVEQVFPTGWGALVSDRAAELVVGRADGSVAVLDVLTGAELWRPGTPDTQAVAYLADVLVTSDNRFLRGVDPRTGEERWSVRTSPSAWVAAAVDERRVVVATGTDVGEGRVRLLGPGLVAVDVETGAVAWEMPIGEPVDAIRGGDDVMVVQTDSATIAFGTDGPPWP